LDPAQKESYDRAARRARAAPQPALATMIADTLAVYGGAMEQPRNASTSKPIAASRCLAALHYIPWFPSTSAPPLPHAAAPATADGAIAGMARVALRIRHTLPGRVLFRLTPRALREALKARIPR
ncbi:MAG: hypothetical protein M3023_02710, partial [Pseudomonadota bacterium]|nr:hypothetical protein [Pseudomonadota bacterium]